VNLLETSLRDVKLIEPRRFGDDRGWFAEVYNQHAFADAGLPASFVQDNQSHSQRGVLRGLHYQLGRPQGKLVRVLRGHIWDVAVDLRPDSPNFGRHAAFDLKGPELADTVRLLWIPEGFAHGFLVLSETADVLYKTTDFYHPAGERTIRWDDRTLNIPWPLQGAAPTVSPKDAAGTTFATAEIPLATASR
jgi:dTDP-4-dehydrorhamnose 3,5-epimerase